VERSENPRIAKKKTQSPRSGRWRSRLQKHQAWWFDCRPLRGLRMCSTTGPGVSLRSTPGFAPTPAPRV